MRLIDADALNARLQKQVGNPTSDELYEVNLCIIEAPTIDAVPVEWLWAAQDKMLKIPWYNFEQCAVVGQLIRAWQKEQEENRE